MRRRAPKRSPREEGHSEHSAVSTEIARLGPRRAAEPREHEVIVDPDRIRRTLWRLCTDEASGTLREGRSAHRQPLRFARMQPGRDLPLFFDVPSGASSTDVEIQLFSARSVYRFTPDRHQLSAGLVATALPRVLVRQRHRCARRVPIEDVKVTFRHPGQPEVRVVRAVVDVSLTGLAMRVGRFDGLAPGQSIEAILDWQERARVRVRGIVRHVSPELDGTGEIAGVELSLLDDEDSQRWRKLVEAAHWPRTIADGTYANDVWECLVDSGYCNLSEKSAEDFDDLREAFAAAMRSIASSPELGCHLAIPSGRGVEATLSTLRIYDRAHFLYGVAKQPGRTPRWTNGKRILRDLYVHATERLIGDPHAEWMIVWVQAQAEFTRFVSHELATRYAASGRSLVFRVDVMEAHRDAQLGEGLGQGQSAPEAGVPGHVGPASAEEIEDVLARIARMRSPIYVDAHDLVPERFAMTALRRAWARAGLVRERAMLVAREGDQVVAAATLELASEGLHLFRLFDVVRTFVLRPGGERHVGALLAAARRFYEERRKPTFVYVREDLESPAPQGFKSLALTDVTLVPASLYPELLEHVYDLTASPEQLPPTR